MGWVLNTKISSITMSLHNLAYLMLDDNMLSVCFPRLVNISLVGKLKH